MSASDLDLVEGTAAGVARTVSDLIFDGSLRAGRPVRESATAAQLGVSRNTVREALRILERSGLVRFERNRGALVSAPTVERTRDLYRARLSVEVGAVHAADMEGAGPVIQQAFDRIHDTQHRGLPRETLEADLAFHAAVVGLAESSRLDLLFQDIATELRLYLSLLSSSVDEYSDDDRVLTEHAGITRAFRAADRDAAIALLADHVKTNADRIVAIVRNRS
ncbi:MAG: GntR family transcriptional regulator [Streptosporangiales bacterium]|nr:GntR family transcriptional regulator [Streptosporangiales bacterium]